MNATITNRDLSQVELQVEVLKQQQALSRYNHYWRQPGLSSYLRYRLGGQ